MPLKLDYTLPIAGLTTANDIFDNPISHGLLLVAIMAVCLIWTSPLLPNFTQILCKWIH